MFSGLRAVWLTHYRHSDGRSISGTAPKFCTVRRPSRRGEDYMRGRSENSLWECLPLTV
jgi:hypothetical protein